MIYFDFQKAFDKVTSKITGIRDGIIDRLTDRKQHIVVDGEVSNWDTTRISIRTFIILNAYIYQ